MTETIRPDQASRDRVATRPALPQSGLSGVVAVLAVITVIAAGALAAFLVSRTQEPVYGAQTDIIFDPGRDLSDEAANRARLTQEAVLRSAAVLGPVASATNSSMQSLNKSLMIEVIGQSNVIRFTVLDPEPSAAQALAQMITAEYQKQIALVNSESVQRPAQHLQRKIDQLLAALANVQADRDARARQRPAGEPSSLEEQQLDGLAQTMQQQVGDLQNQLTALELQQFAQPQGRILTPVHLLDGPIKPRPIQAAALGALVGVFIAGGTLLLLNWWRSSSHNISALEL